ncbi:hypothetical protein FRB95_004950 [Tulasnella sp. JGI-2019a]|nr:hypothetical protein FRB95_004950 [Tulasnella sp. JGI-2019a]
MLTELQSSVTIIQSFDDSLKTFSNGPHHIRSAKARHHNSLPISRLPDDLPVEIFRFASGMKDHSTRSCYGHRIYISMLATLVFVCHEWREIMHNTSSLWAYVSTNHRDMVNLECLARSDQVSLRVLLNCPVFRRVARHGFETKIFQEVHRWKCADISGTFMELVHQPAPLLERLEIEGNMEGAPVAYNLFCGSASRLRHLTLTNIIIPWDSSLLSHLKTLRIRYHQNYSPSVQQVVHVL